MYTYSTERRKLDYALAHHRELVVHHIQRQMPELFATKTVQQWFQDVPKDRRKMQILLALNPSVYASIDKRLELQHDTLISKVSDADAAVVKSNEDHHTAAHHH